MRVTFYLNKEKCEINTYPMRRLVDVIRDDFALTGTKNGCGEGECGACLVFLNDVLVNSCLVPISQVNNKSVITIEGLRENPLFKKIMISFAEHGGVQCGFCTPGFIMSAFNLLSINKNPSEEEIKEAFSGNICRCTGYSKINKSLLEALKDSL